MRCGAGGRRCVMATRQPARRPLTTPRLRTLASVRACLPSPSSIRRSLRESSVDEDIYPDVPVLWINLCIAYARTGQRDAAEEAYERAREIAPNHPQLWRCPFNLGRRLEAVKLRLEATRLRIEMMAQTPPELLEQVPDQQ